MRAEGRNRNKKIAEKRKVSNLNGCSKSAMDKEAVEIRVLSNGKNWNAANFIGEEMQKYTKT